MPADLSRRQALGLVCLLWAAIYLPALGTLELKGEEGRRILPAVTMLATGNWIVPSVGGEEYFSKPPLINWAIAGAMHFSGRQDEWAARVPSVLSALVLGLGSVWLLTEWLGAQYALLAAIFMLTGIGMMEKGRLAEIESMYVSLYGLALMSWLSCWRRNFARGGNRTGWSGWTVPWIFLGLGLLTKGPLHVVLFYAVVAAILASAGRLRDLWCWPHLGGLMLMLGIFGGWALPYLRMVSAEQVGHAWTHQMGNRFQVDEGFETRKWLLVAPRALGNFIPWVVLLPLCWTSRRRRGELVPSVARDSRAPADAVTPSDPAGHLDDAIMRGAGWATAGCFVVLSFVPGGIARYTLPLLVPASILLALVCSRWERGGLPGWLPLAWVRTLLAVLAVAAVATGVAAGMGGGGLVRWGLAAGIAGLCVWLIRQTRAVVPVPGALPALGILSAAAMATWTFIYALGGVPRLQARERLRPAAVEINRLTAHAPGEAAPIYIYESGYLPLIFYLRPPPRYVQRTEELPVSACDVLVKEKDAPILSQQLAARGQSAVRAAAFKDLPPRGKWVVLRVAGKQSPASL